ncbi:MAG TPA: hypothetical protein VF924_04150 [Stellaceae bacterium]
MWMQIKAVVVSAAFLAGAVGIAWAQGSITQDPGSLTPGNLTFQDLGPAGPAPGPTERSQTTRLPGGYGTSGTAGTVTGPGISSTGFGAGNTSGFGGNAAGSRR